MKYEKKYILFFSLILVIILVNHFLFNPEENESNIFTIPFLALFCVYILNQLLYRTKYFNKSVTFTSIKFITLLVAAFLFFNGNIFVFGTGVLLYLLNCIEIALLDYNEDINRRSKDFILSFIPLALCVVIAMIYQNNLVSNLIFLLLFVTVLFGIYSVMHIGAEELSEKIDEQHALWESSIHANETLITSQEKIKAINEKIILQKMEMEQKNNQLNRLSSEMYIQNELLNYISSTLDLEQLMDLVTDAIVGAIGVDTCSLVILNTEKDLYDIKTKSNADVNDVNRFILRAIENHEMDDYFKKTSPIIDAQVDMENYPFILEREVGSIIITPLIRSNRTYGLIISEHISKDFFGEFNLQFFTNIATQITIAYNNAFMYTKMEEIATKDGLTGIFNRRHFQLQYIKLFNEMVSTNDMISVVMMDIDKFKNVNDTYGHIFGDEAIKMVARLIDQFATQNNGFAGRYGGEEFVLAIPKQTLSETVKVITQMHEAIKSEPLYFKNQKVYINISLGISHYPDFGTSYEDLLNRSDNAMYYSKRNGRGRITVDSDELNNTNEQNITIE